MAYRLQASLIHSPSLFPSPQLLSSSFFFITFFYYLWGKREKKRHAVTEYFHYICNQATGRSVVLHNLIIVYRKKCSITEGNGNVSLAWNLLATQALHG